METIEFSRLELAQGAKVLDLGAGGGRHALRASELGYQSFALDRSPDGLVSMNQWIDQIGSATSIEVSSVVGDASALPFPDDTFDAVVCSEVLEHVLLPKDVVSEIYRVLKSGGTAALTVPRTYPEVVCWLISKEYHSARGGHIRVFTRKALIDLCIDADLCQYGFSYTHALHAPYWWLKCAVGVNKNDSWIVDIYERLLIKQMSDRDGLLSYIDRTFGRLVGKSMVVYARKR